jgi:alpha-tubulin suppressor-like RCC1 family protein
MIKDIIIRTQKVAPVAAQYSLWGWGDNTFGQLDDGILSIQPYQIDNLTTWVSGSGGGSHTVALKSDGTMWGWGRNAAGQIGDNSTTTRSSPVQVGTLTEWSKISAANSQTMAIKSDGTLWGWGLDEGYRVGIPTPNTPQKLGTESNWSKVSVAGLGGGAIKTDGTLWMWGQNVFGALGLNDIVARSYPVQVGTLTDWTEISTGTSSTMAIKTDGTLWGWGGNPTGQLGDGTIVSKSSPIQIGTLTDWANALTSNGLSNDGNTLALKTNGTMWAWGSGANGRLGINTVFNRSSPVQIGTLTTWSYIANGANNGFAIQTDGTLWGWGLNTTGQVGDGTTVDKSSPVQIGTLTNWSKVSISANVTVAVKTDGTLWGWGNNVSGAVGDGTTTNRSSPVQIGTLTNWSSVFGGQTYGINFALKTDNTLWGWGVNSTPVQGAVGDGTAATKNSPVQIGIGITWSSLPSPSSSNLNNTAIGAAIDNSGGLYVWGVNTLSQLGLNHTYWGGGTAASTPGQVAYSNNWSDVSINAVHGLGRQTDGTLWSWGLGTNGQLGLNDTTTRVSPIQIGTLTNWSKISVGASHSMAIKTDGTLWAWGFNTNGQLGNEPITPTRLNLDSWSDTDAGSSYTMGIKGDGTLWGWGLGTTGQLGIPIPVSPIQIGVDTDWTKISAGTSYTMAIKTDGTLWAWGENAQGQLGDGTVISRSSPVQIGTRTDWSKVSAGATSTHAHTAAIRTDGTLWVWGSNSSGQLGQNNVILRSSPVQVGTLTGWEYVDVSKLSIGGFTVAKRTDGTLWSWGYNLTYGTLGINNLINRSSPVQIGTLSNWDKFAVGNVNTYAIKTDGTLWSWGWGLGGSIGDNTIVNKSSPVQIGTLTDWLYVDAGSNPLLIKTDGTLWVWGFGDSGRLGENNTVNRSSPIQIGTDTNWVSGGCGSQNNYAIKSNGTLWAWGLNTVGQLGDGTLISKSSPVQIGTLTNWSKIEGGSYSAGGSHHAIGLKTDGTLWGWGLNSSGQLGLNNTLSYNATGYSSPTQVGTINTWSKVSTANAFTIGRRTDGTLWSWGLGTTGQLGDGTVVTKSSPIQIGTRTDWSSNFSTFNSHTMAITTGGSLYGWGSNANGELGQTNIINRSSPVQVGTLTNWSTVSVGGNHSLSIKTDGTLWSWGLGTSGQLGDNTAVTKSSPVQVGTLTNWSKVSAGLSHSMAVKTDGTLWTWGGDGSGELGIRPIQPTLISSNEWTSVNTTEYHIQTANPRNNSTFAIKTDGTLWSWGVNSFGQLGLNDTVSRYSPVQVGTLSNWSKIVNSVEEFSSRSSTWSIKTDGTLWSWGNNSFYQLADGTNINRSSPVQIGTLTDWIDITSFSENGTGAPGGVIVKKTNGTLWSWGKNFYGQLGHNNTVDLSSPVQIGTDADWMIVDGGSSAHILAIKTDGTLWSWGRNTNGQLGDGTFTNRSSPVQIGTLTDWSSVSAGYIASLAIKTNGTLWMWGLNNIGQLGDGTTINRNSPVQIGTLSNWTYVSAGTSHCMSIKSDGTLWGWGLNTSAQIGDGTFVNKSSPVQIGILNNWSKVYAGCSYTVAIDTNGYLYSWGLNSFGELGTGNTIGTTTTSISSPIQVGTLTTWSDVWALSARTYATKTDGTLWGWGAATNYLGDTLASNVGFGTFPTTPTTRYSPVQIGTKTNWSKIGRGTNHIIGLKSDGSMLGWGINTNGQLGLNFFGSNTARSSPVQIGDDTFWSEVAAGSNHTLAVKNDGTLWAWGLNTSGRVGNISTVSRSYPVQIGTLTNWSKVDAGTDYSRAIKTDGTLWTWGDNTSGKLGDATIVSKSSPIQIGTLVDWTTFNGTGSHSIAITTGGTLWTWGLASSGQLGYTMQRSSPVQIGDGYSWSKIDGGDLALHTMGVKTDGTLWGWGANNLGQLGDNTVIYRSSPTQIGTLTNWSTVNLSISHTMALKDDGTLWGWGRNNSGQVGDGTTVDKSSPVQIGTSTGWSRVSAGGNADTTMMTMAVKTDGTMWGWGSITNGKIGTILPYVPQRVGTTSEWATVANNVNDTFDASFSLGIKTDGSLWSWGLNSSGQLGLNNTSTTNSPVQVGTLTNWLSVAAGRNHTIAVKSDGTLWAWGGNSAAGELGDGTSVGKSSPIQIGTLTDWSKVSVGFQTSHVVKTDGTLWGWGQNAGGKIGDGTLVSKNSPVQVGTLTNWLTVVSSPSHTMAIKTDGTLWGWGGNATGQIGDGTVINRSSPVQIGTLTDWYKISTGGNHTISVKTDGTLWGWGTGGRVGDSTSVSRSSPVQIGTLTTWSDTFSQNGNSFAIKTDGTLWGWGSNTRGQRGNGSIDPNGFSPTTSPIQISSDISWSTMSKGGSFSSLAIDTSGNLYSWGQNTNGELGLSNFVSYNVTTATIPGQVGNETSWSQLSLGADHGIATKTTGTLWGWGVNGAGQIGDGTVTTRSSPIQIGTLTDWSKVSAGASHTMAIKTDNTLWAWGLGTSGQLGLEANTPSWTIDRGTYWDNITTGPNFSFSIKTDGTLWSWGGNAGGQLGDGTVRPRSSPVQIGTLTDWSIIDGATGTSTSVHMAGIRTNGTLWMWGLNSSGQLGQNNTINRSSPVQVGTDTTWTDISLGDTHTIGIKSGQLWAWGPNFNGQLGGGATGTPRSSPVQVGTLTDWSKISCGAIHSIAIKTDGTLWGWGTGIAATRPPLNSVNSPVQIGTLTGWSKISSSSSHTMAIRTDGTLWSWGLNSNGQLGLGDTIDRSSPVQVGTMTNWSKISAGFGHAVAVKTDGTLWSWGLNTSGQIGDGTLINRSSPVQIGTLTNWLDAIGGQTFTFGIKTDGTLRAWGVNDTGQLGRGFAGSNISRSSPVQIGEDQWTSVYSGNLFTSAIRGDGTLWSWGVNTAGYLGDASVLSRSAPIQIGTYSKWTQVSAGASHTIAIREE